MATENCKPMNFLSPNMMHSVTDCIDPVSLENLTLGENFSDSFPYSFLLHPSKKLLSSTCLDSSQNVDSGHNLFSTLSTASPSTALDTRASRDSFGEDSAHMFPLQKVIERTNFVPIVPVKLFVNRVPKWMCNDNLRSLFSHYGDVLECYILKDYDGHKGCAFVKFASIVDAHKAIVDLHGKKILNEEAGPVQLKYADGEIERLGLSPDVQPGGEAVKVFVGCLPKNCTEDELFGLFSRFGRVDEVFLIRDINKQSKCSAFVTFPKKEMALSAISALDRQYTLPSGRRPIEVRLAKSKISKRTAKFTAENISSSDFSVNPSSGFPLERFPLSTQETFSLSEVAATATTSTPTNSKFGGLTPSYSSYLPMLYPSSSSSINSHGFSPLQDMSGYHFMNSTVPSRLPGNNEVYSPYSNWMEYLLPSWNNYYYNNTNALSQPWTPSLPSEWPPSPSSGYYMAPPTSLNRSTSTVSTSPLPSTPLGAPVGVIEEALFSSTPADMRGMGISSLSTFPNPLSQVSPSSPSAIKAVPSPPNPTEGLPSPPPPLSSPPPLRPSTSSPFQSTTSMFPMALTSSQMRDTSSSSHPNYPLTPLEDALHASAPLEYPPNPSSSHPLHPSTRGTPLPKDLPPSFSSSSLSSPMQTILHEASPLRHAEKLLLYHPWIDENRDAIPPYPSQFSHRLHSL